MLFLGALALWVGLCTFGWVTQSFQHHAYLQWHSPVVALAGDLAFVNGCKLAVALFDKD